MGGRCLGTAAGWGGWDAQVRDLGMPKWEIFKWRILDCTSRKNSHIFELIRLWWVDFSELITYSRILLNIPDATPPVLTAIPLRFYPFHHPHVPAVQLLRSKPLQHRMQGHQMQGQVILTLLLLPWPCCFLASLRFLDLVMNTHKIGFARKLKTSCNVWRSQGMFFQCLKKKAESKLQCWRSQHTSAYFSSVWEERRVEAWNALAAYVSIPQHTSAYERRGDDWTSRPPLGPLPPLHSCPLFSSSFYTYSSLYLFTCMYIYVYVYIYIYI